MTASLISAVTGSGCAFPGLPIPKDAVIERAYLEFYSRSNTSNTVTYTIKGENSGNARALRHNPQESYRPQLCVADGRLESGPLGQE